MSTLTNIEDPKEMEEMTHKTRRILNEEIHYNLEIIACDPSSFENNKASLTLHAFLMLAKGHNSLR